MAVETTDVKTSLLACNGSTTTFPFSFKILAETDLEVYLVVDATEAKTLLTITSDYTVNATNDDFSAGGNVETVSTYASGNSILIKRATENKQETDYTHGEDLAADTLEDDLDRRAMVAQEYQEHMNRALVFPPQDDTTLDPELPPAADRKGKYLYFDATNGEPTMVDAIDPGEVTITAFAETLLDDADADAILATLGFSAFAKTLIDDADADAFLATLIASVTGGESGFRSTGISIHTVTDDNYTVLDDDGYTHILVSTGASNRTITLPTAAANAGRELFIKKTDIGAGEVIVDGEGAELINQTATWQLNGIDAYLHIICDGTGWHVIGSHDNWRIVEHNADFSQGSAVQNQWYKVTNFELAYPTGGVWEIEYLSNLNSSTAVVLEMTCADSANALTDEAYSCGYYLNANLARPGTGKSFTRTLTSSGTLHINIRTTAGGGPTINVSDSAAPKGHLRMKRVA